jgi:hypothetical protein
MIEEKTKVPNATATLIAERLEVGAETPRGRVISGLIEQLDIRLTYVRPAWAKDPRQTLDYQISKSLDRLAR